MRVLERCYFSTIILIFNIQHGNGRSLPPSPMGCKFQEVRVHLTHFCGPSVQCNVLLLLSDE